MDGIIVGILGNILRTYAVYRLMELFYEPKKIRKEWKFLAYVCFVVLTSGGYYLFRRVNINAWTNIVGLALIVSCYKGKIAKNIMVITCIFTMNAITEGLIVLSLFRNLEMSVMVASLSQCLASIVIFLEVEILGRTISVKEKGFRLPLHMWLGLMAVPILNFCVLAEGVERRLLYGERLEFSAAGALTSTLLIFFLYGALENYYKEQSDRAEFTRKIEMYSSQLDIMAESYERVRILRHDLKHHMTELKYLLSAGDSEGATQYMEDLEKHLMNPVEYVTSGNREVDSTLNYLLGIAEQKLLKTDIHIGIPEEVELHNFSINVILGNLLENAIEAAEQSDKKYLQVEMTVKQGILHIKVQNSYDGELCLESNKIMTRKKDKSQHGIGLKSVRRIVEESDGTMKIDWTDKLFSVDILLYLNQNQEK